MPDWREKPGSLNCQEHRLNIVTDPVFRCPGHDFSAAATARECSVL